MEDGLTPGEITAEDLEQAGWVSNPEGTLWWKYEDEEKYTFADACEIYDESRYEED